MRKPSHSTARAQRGLALVVSLLLVVIVALLGVSMFRDLGLQEKIAGNTRDKQRSFQAAQSALSYGEWWLLNQSSGGTGASCSGASAIDASVMSNILICSNALASPGSLLSSTPRFEFTPAAMSVNSSGGLGSADSDSDKDINYYGKPAFYISSLGTTPDGKGQLYQVTAAGYGGTQNGVTVVQSVYQLKSAYSDLTGP